jgi:hypothetical protein
MAKPEFGSIILSGMFVTVILFGFMLLVSDGTTKLGISSPSGDDIQSLQSFNESAYTLISISEETKNDFSNLQGNANLLDMFGSIWSGAYGALLTAGQSFNVFFDLISTGVGDLPLGPMGPIISYVLGGALIVVIVFFIFARIITKSDST